MIIKGIRINPNQITNVTEWDRNARGFAGCIEYTNGDNRYLLHTTPSELRELRAAGFAPEFIRAKYSGTY